MPEMIVWTSVLHTPGTDRMLQIEFLNETGKFIRGKIARLTLPAFRYIPMKNALLSTGNIGLYKKASEDTTELVRVASYDLYVDRYHSEQVLVDFGLKDGQSRNIWLYSNIAIHETGLWIEHRLASTDDSTAACETLVLQEVLKCPELIIGEWTISAGGDGDNGVVGANGQGKESLRQCLQYEIPCYQPQLAFR